MTILAVIKSKEIMGFDVSIPEPRYTTKIYDPDILTQIIKEKYKKGVSGKEYNLITKYTSSIFEKIEQMMADTHCINIRYSKIRTIWLIAVINNIKNKPYKIVSDNNKTQIIKL